MNAFPTEKDVQQCVEILLNQYQVPDRIIKNMFGQTNFTRLNTLLKSLGKDTLDIKRINENAYYRKRSLSLCW